MSDIAIHVDNLGKRYRIGARVKYKALRDTLTDALSSPFRAAASLLNGHRPSVAVPLSDNHIWALKDVSFDVKQGDVVGIIGRNGAGKSTLLKILSRITKPSEGYAKIYGRVGSLLEVGTGFHPELTGRENIYLNGAILGMMKREIDRKFAEIVAFAEVEKFIDTPVKHYSSGMYVRLAFAVAAHLEPEILLVDEVLAVGDAAFQKKCLGKMGDVARAGRTVVFVSHNMAAVKVLCNQGILLEKGEIYQIGPVTNTIETYMLKVANEAKRGTRDIFPVCSQSYGISINSCSAAVEQASNGQLNLKIELEIESKGRLGNIGVGLELTTANGVLVTWLAPAVTNYVIEEINGRCQCIFHCDEVNRYLAGGEYVLGVWLSKPRIHSLVKVEEAALITIPPQDIFSSGVYFEAQRYGVVPLPFNFSVQENCYRH